MIAVFSDFDGTITSMDTGTHIIDKFLGRDRRKCLDKQVLDGQTTFREAVIEMWKSVQPKDISVEQAGAMIIKDIPLDQGFMDFYNFSIEEGIRFTCISSGLDVLIAEYLKHHFPKGLHPTTKVIANGLKVHKDHWEIIYLDDSEYGHDKGSHLRDYRTQYPDHTIVFIGDGISDIPAAMSADVVLAKKGKDLETFCLRESISYTSWNDFRDIKSFFKTHLVK